MISQNILNNLSIQKRCMKITERIDSSHYNLPSPFLELLDQVKNEGEITITVRDLIGRYKNCKKRSSNIVNEIEFIFSLFGVRHDLEYSNLDLEDSNLDDEIKLVTTRPALKAKFCDLIEKVHKNGEVISTPQEIIKVYNESSRRTEDLVNDIHFTFELFNVKVKELYACNCGFYDEIELRSNLNGTDKNCRTEPETFKVPVDYAGNILVSQGKNPRVLYFHQEEAMKKLDEKIIKSNKPSFSGLLVIPTGGGKTTVAAQWLLKNYIDKDKKVIWIAHRHELLNQAKESFENNSYSDILKKRKSFNYRIISGKHDKPVNIQSSDDIVIASKDSLNSDSGLKYLSNICNNAELFLVIDEAHHAIAKTYRKLIDLIKCKASNFKMLGLTATPYRTAESEEGLLGKLFTDGIIFSVDLRELISRGILSDPIFYEQKTNFEMYEVFNEKDIEKIKHFDIDTIGKATAKIIGENKKRNNAIVNYYLKNKKEFKQTLVFSLGVDNAIALNSLFKRKGIASDYIISNIRDALTGVTNSAKDNEYKINKFRKGDLEVLINVNILTEGTDLPKVQTVFLTRPTISKILMTQMIGRGLRGEKAGGTKKTFIVSFIDDWKDKISWVNPEKLYIEDNLDFKGPEPINNGPKITRLISIEKIEEFAAIMDRTVDTSELEKLDFIERVPVGLYSFKILISEEDGSEKEEEIEKNCQILVYDNVKEAYFDFTNELDDIFSKNNIQNKEELDENTLQELSKKMEDEYFYGYDKLIGYRIEDVKDILRYYSLYENTPLFIKFDERDKFDIKKIAKEIIDKDIGPIGQEEYFKNIWENNSSHWKAFFGYSSFEYFINEVQLAIRRELRPESYQRDVSKPEDIKELRELEKLSMAEIYEKYPEHWRKLRNEVYEMSKDDEGFYTSAISGIKNKKKSYFQIDHIKPRDKGGLTTLENLQILTKKENANKSNKTS